MHRVMRSPLGAESWRGAIACLALLLLWGAAADADESTWSAEPSRVQLARDPQLIAKGKGMLFVPAMSVPLGNEPTYQVYENQNRVASAVPGRGVLLPPGYYDVLIGSGVPAQLMKYRVEVIEGSVTMMKPDWSALVIDVVDPSRASVNERYELLEGDTGEVYRRAARVLRRPTGGRLHNDHLHVRIACPGGDGTRGGCRNAPAPRRARPWRWRVRCPVKTGSPLAGVRRGR